MFFQKKAFFNFKYPQIAHHNSNPSGSLSKSERHWLCCYVLSDGRFSKHAKLLLKNFFSQALATELRRSLLRSYCIASNTKRGVTKFSFWAGRHVLSERMKRGLIPGFRKC